MPPSPHFVSVSAAIITFIAVGFVSLKLTYKVEKDFGVERITTFVVLLLLSLTLCAPPGVMYVLRDDEGWTDLRITSIFICLSLWFGSFHLSGYIGKALVPNHKIIQVSFSTLLFGTAFIVVSLVYFATFGWY